MEIRGVDIVVIPAYQPSDFRIVKVVAIGLRRDCCRTTARLQISSGFEQLNNLTGVNHVENTGRAALKTAFACIRKQEDATIYIVTMDADGQHLPEDMEHTIMAARLHPGSLVLKLHNFDKEMSFALQTRTKITR